jgi:hypothetical protein
MAYSLEIHIPRSRPFSPIINTLRERFPYREGEWFDQTVSDQRAPAGYDLAYIRLVAPLEAAQIIYLEHGKTAGLITAYSVHEIASE